MLGQASLVDIAGSFNGMYSLLISPVLL